MNQKIITFLMLHFSWNIFIMCVLTTNPTLLNAQKILVIEKPGTVKNIKFEVNDRIKFKLENNMKINGRIQKLTDSSVFVNREEFLFSKIKYFYKDRFGWKVLSNTTFQAGVAYLSIEALNNLANNERPVVSDKTLKPSVILMIIGILASPLVEKRLDIRKRWRVRVLDFDSLNNGIITH